VVPRRTNKDGGARRTETDESHAEEGVTPTGPTDLDLAAYLRTRGRCGEHSKLDLVRPVLTAEVPYQVEARIAGDEPGI
jgi:hypothetical protein